MATCDVRQAIVMDGPIWPTSEWDRPFTPLIRERREYRHAISSTRHPSPPGAPQHTRSASQGPRVRPQSAHSHHQSEVRPTEALALTTSYLGLAQGELGVLSRRKPLPARPSTAPAAHKAAASGWKPCYVADCASKPLPGPGPLGDMRRVVDDPLASVKVVREVFSSRALHVVPSQAGLHHQRWMPRPPLPAPVASQCLPALSQPRALSAGGFPGWKLSSSTPAKAGPIIPAPASTTQQPSLASKSGHHVTQHAHHPALPCGLLPAAASSTGEQAGMQQLTSFFSPTAKAMAAKPKEVGRSAALAAASPAAATAARPAVWGQGRASSSPGGAAKRVQAVQQGSATGQRVAPVGANSNPDQQPGAEQPDTQRPLQPAEGLLAIPGVHPAARAHSGSSPACPDKDATTAACHASLPSHTSQPAVFSHSGGGGDIADMEPKHGGCAGGGGREAIQDACSPETVQAAAEEPVGREEGGASHDPFLTQTQV